MAVACDTGAVTEGLAEGLAESYADVFDGVVAVHMQVTCTRDFDIEAAMVGKLF